MSAVSFFQFVMFVSPPNLFYYSTDAGVGQGGNRGKGGLNKRDEERKKCHFSLSSDIGWYLLYPDMETMGSWDGWVGLLLAFCRYRPPYKALILSNAFTVFS